MCNKDIKMKSQTTKTKGINFISKYSEEIPWKKKFSLHSKSRGPQKTRNICIYFKAHQHSDTFRRSIWAAEQSSRTGSFVKQGPFAYMKWPNKGKNIFLSPRKHKEIILHLAVRDPAKHTTEAIRSALPSAETILRDHWNKRTLEKQGTFLKTMSSQRPPP